MESKIEILDFKHEGYKKLVTYDSWRVAMLNYIENLNPLLIDSVQAHLKTDETFILLEGKCILYLCDVVDDVVVDTQGIDMEQHKVYNIKKGVYHTHTLSMDGKVLIVENEDTADYNSPRIYIDEEIQNRFHAIMSRLWK